MKKPRAKRSLKKDKTLWIVDFDYTLYDVYRFMDDLGKILKKEFGVTLKTYKESKVILQSNNLYTFEGHMRAAKKIHPASSSLPYWQVIKRIEKLAKRSSQYFFADAMPFMRSIAKDGEVILLSHGHTLQQKRKMKASGIEKYVDRIIIVPNKIEKAAWIKKLAKNRERTIIVNDDPEETLDIIALQPNVSKIFLVERRAGKYYPITPHKDYTVIKNLRNIRI
jgi:hypothetical protein